MIKLKLEKIVNTDKNGKGVLDKEGSLTFIRYDVIALSQLLNAVDSKAVQVGEYKALLGLDDKVRNVLLSDRKEVETTIEVSMKNEIELTLDESALLKKLLNNPQNDRISFSLFHIRTISAILEQLK